MPNKPDPETYARYVEAIHEAWFAAIAMTGCVECAMRQIIGEVTEFAAIRADRIEDMPQPDDPSIRCGKCDTKPFPSLTSPLRVRLVERVQS
ncbi:hypothetical protein [Roseicella sp. DB1501]|uniref:hypothetical protein n=1 Tax=Roseicella sp. DB1501 TaxID=2730925 RepID=UPI0014912160|nr:hypothetical protein [Roseicella sp. DB1501]NOG70483.1 hypothetical protein [Roseicella sp. DB1501]